SGLVGVILNLYGIPPISRHRPRTVRQRTRKAGRSDGERRRRGRREPLFDELITEPCLADPYSVAPVAGHVPGTVDLELVVAIGQLQIDRPEPDGRPVV